MNTKILLGIVAAMLVIGGGVYFYSQNQTPRSEIVERLHIKQLSFIVPQGWTAEFQKGANESEIYFLHSPDYKEPKPGCSVGGYCNLPSGGTEITVRVGGFYNLHASSKENMQLAIEDETWAPTSKRIIEIDEKPALFAEYDATDEVLGNGEGAFARGPLGDVQFEIGLISSKKYSENKQLFEAFLNQIEIN